MESEASCAWSLVASELKLHAGRDFLYAPLFVGLPLMEWRGTWAIVIFIILLAEIVLTLWDFIEEAKARKPLGDVYPGERVTHAIMGILYGAMLVFLLSTLQEWWSLETALAPSRIEVEGWLRPLLVAMGVGVFFSGIRDLYAALDLPGASWPWKRHDQGVH
jgi:hypothetical protein